MSEIERDTPFPSVSANTVGASELIDTDIANADCFEAVSGQQPTRSTALRQLATLPLAISVATVPLLPYNPTFELRRSGAVSALQALRPRRGRRVSLGEARSIALDIMAVADKRLQDERGGEAHFLLSFDDDLFIPTL